MITFVKFCNRLIGHIRPNLAQVSLQTFRTLITGYRTLLLNAISPKILYFKSNIDWVWWFFSGQANWNWKSDKHLNAFGIKHFCEIMKLFYIWKLPRNPCGEKFIKTININPLFCAMSHYSKMVFKKVINNIINSQDHLILTSNIWNVKIWMWTINVMIL
jgi:hypothetical protein